MEEKKVGGPCTQGLLWLVYSWLLSYLDEFVLTRAYIQKRLPNYKCMVKYAFLESGNRAIKNNPGPQKPSAAPLGLGAPSPQMEAVFCLRGSALPAGHTGARPLPCRRPCSGSPLVSVAVDWEELFSTVLLGASLAIWLCRKTEDTGLRLEHAS